MDIVVETLFSILVAIVLGMIYRLMTWLSRIEKQVVELKTEIKWIKTYILKISNNNTGGKDGVTTDNNANI
jgi:hypothetical protein